VLDFGRIVFRYGSDHRKGWRDEGMLKDMQAFAQYVRCISPAELDRLNDLAGWRFEVAPKQRLND
jgi:hypothetical protein